MTNTDIRLKELLEKCEEEERMGHPALVIMNRDVKLAVIEAIRARKALQDIKNFVEMNSIFADVSELRFCKMILDIINKKP